ncbi:MAG: hypothetical protein ACJ788_11910, partial [Ktedonobacteraceae bacterium]
REQQQKQAQEEKEEQLRTLIREKRLYAAREFVKTRGEGIADRDKQLRTIEATITQAQDLMNLLRASGVNQDDKIAWGRRASSICADLPDLEDLPPPSPPSNLQAKVRETVVSLSWNPSTTQNVFYTIMRKSLAQPNSVKDGKMLDTVIGHTYDDATPLSGLPLYYAVFSGYDKVTSNQAALLTQPVLLTQDVLTVTAQVDDRQVDLTWEPPPNVHSVVVVRTEQTPPNSIHDGTRVADHHPNQKRLIDRNVQNGQTYYYGFYCQFKNHEGRLDLSPGQSISATPDTPPQPINHIDIKSTRIDQHYEIVISWKRPNKGNAVVMKREKPFPLPIGKVLPETELNKYGEILQYRPDTVTDKWTKPGMAYYTPIVIFQNMAYIGTSQLYACVDNVSNLRHQNIGSAIRFHWRWPENCQEVLISYSTEGWPQSNDPTVTNRRVNFAEYDRTGHYDLRGTVDQDYYIVVSAIINQDGAKITAEGIRLFTRQATKLVFTYEIKNPTMFRRKRTLHIMARTPGTLPTLLLIGKRDRLPFRKADGDLLQRIEPTLIDGKELVIELSERTFPTKTFGKLFLEDDNLHELISIHHPTEDKLRLS